MAEAFAKLPVTHLKAFNSLLIGLAIGLAAVFLALVLGGLALNSSGATLAVMAVAASFMMMAIGVGIAATGVGLMAQGFTVMFQAIELDKLLALGLFFGILLYGAPLLAAAGWAIAAISLALGGFSIALKLMSFDTLGDITSFMKSFEDFETQYIDDMAEAVTRLGDAIEQMDMKKTLLLETVLATTVVAGATVGAALAPAMLMAGAVGGGVTAAMQANQTPAGGSQGTKIQAPLVIKLGDTGEKLKEFVIEVVGEEVKVANA